MDMMCWPSWLDSVWAKSVQSGEQTGETLAQHTWSVLARLADLAHNRPRLAGVLEAPQLWHCLFWACLLHDFGKATRGFQAMLRTGERWRHRHEVFSLAFLDWIAPSLSETECIWVLAAIVSHHRDAEEINERYNPIAEPDPLVDLLSEFNRVTVSGLWRWIQECVQEWIVSLNFSSFDVHNLQLVDEETAVSITCVEGVQRTRRWLNCYRRFIRQLPSEKDEHILAALIALRGLTTTADHAASAHLSSLPSGVQCSWRALATSSLELTDPDREAYTHQRESAACHGESAFLIAPTGSGKTEAALFWAMGDGTDLPPRLFYALPYQASMNAMYDRLGSLRYFGEGQVGLQHGRAFQALYQRFLDGESGPAASVQAAAWKRNLTTLHACPIKVFSPYQMLKAVYGLKGFESMLTDYVQAAFVFDEIHAYEPARLATILAVVKHLRERYGARYFFMSATFPRVHQHLLSHTLGVHIPIVAEYSLFEQFLRHRLIMRDGDLLTDGIAPIVADVQQGKSVLVCCNTVRRAQHVRKAMLKLLPPTQVELIHSRFTLQDRLTRETSLLARCAIDAAHTAFALVATQVVEVSLNIDLDTIYTDPAPLDALFQRFGRVNRARKKGIVPVWVFRQPANGQFVYSDILVQKTLAVLERKHNQEIDESQINQWLDEVYAEPKVFQPWIATYKRQAVQAEQLLRELRPFNTNHQREEEFERLFDGIEILPACFERDYLARVANNEFLEASQFFVSISQKKYQQLLRKGKIMPVGGEKRQRWLAQLLYDPDLGLCFDPMLEDEPDHD